MVSTRSGFTRNGVEFLVNLDILDYVIRYQPQDIEKKWQKIWEEKGIYYTADKSDKRKYYCLVMFPYSSGDLHIGHWYNFAPADIFARYKRMNGYNVLHPIGFDSFGLPGENAAIKSKIHPQTWTEKNIERMTQQLKSTGNSYDWRRIVATSREDYYKWTQWMFLLMYKLGLAYRAKTLANWCPDCQTVLANEQVIEGKCWRCTSVVVQREIDQWMFKITQYADRLLEDLKKIDWPKKTVTMQRNWIGRSVGVELNFPVLESQEKIKLFTTRIDTIFGVTFVVLAPEHQIVTSLLNFQFKISNSKLKEIQEYVERSKRKSERQRKENKEKTGVFTGLHAVNPLNNEKIPVYISEYVLMGYGTGAIMGVPAHDRRDYEFAKAFKLPIRTVIIPESGVGRSKYKVHEGYGVLINSGNFTGIKSQQAHQKINNYIEDNHFGTQKVYYHLRDWGVSRQRYWGPPIPIIYCEKCGVVPVPELDLPVLLPYDVDYLPKGVSPLGTNRKFVNTKCPTCSGAAKRETDTMDTFVDSSWYFLRFPNPDLKTAAFSETQVNYWLPVDMYIGGVEHSVLHLLYSRFLTKVLKDEGLIKFDEPFTTLRHQGIVLGPDGYRMSKSRGNVVNPDDLVQTYGADTVRTYLAFMGPYDQGGPWNPRGIEGIYRFLGRVWTLVTKKTETLETETSNPPPKSLEQMHRTIKRVSGDINSLHFNTAVAALMEWLNFLQDQKQITRGEIEIYLKLLAPFAPHITEELWEIIGRRFSIHQESWPKFREEYLVEKEATIIVQINGKLRGKLIVASSTPENEVKEKALNLEKIRKYLENKKISKKVYIPHKLINFVTN